MPDVAQTKADILKQYPGAQLDLDRLKAALQMPTERPVDVGIIPEEIQTIGNNGELQKSESAKLPVLEQKAAMTDSTGPKTDWKPKEPETAEHQQSPIREPAPATPLPLNPQRFFYSETSRL
jgi:hypothetical protein